MTNEIQTALTSAAKYNMGIARRKGCVVITQTKLGNVEARYEAATKLYEAVNFNTGLGLQRPVKAALFAQFLMQDVFIVS